MVFRVSKILIVGLFSLLMNLFVIVLIPHRCCKKLSKVRSIFKIVSAEALISHMVSLMANASPSLWNRWRVAVLSIVLMMLLMISSPQKMPGSLAIIFAV